MMPSIRRPRAINYLLIGAAMLLFCSPPAERKTRTKIRCGRKLKYD